MIASVSGTVAAITGEVAVIEMGGAGIAVQCTPTTLATLRPGQDARLSTSLVVREDSLTLFGFATDDERVVFEILQSVTGVGPRLARQVRRHTYRETQPIRERQINIGSAAEERLPALHLPGLHRGERLHPRSNREGA